MLSMHLNVQTFATGRNQFLHVTEGYDLKNSRDFPEVMQLENNYVKKK